MDSVHKTVLLNETIDSLNLNSNSKVIDCTFGGGGHSMEICKKYPGIEIFAFDQDQNAFKKAENKFKDMVCKITFQNLNFRDLSLGTTADAIIFDLGLSSDQLENSGRGFSFKKEEPLLMTMKAKPVPEDLTARDIVNNWSEENLAKIIFGYGEEKYSKRIAKRIAEARTKSEIVTTCDLVKIIEDAVPKSYGRRKIHLATKTFQALRIAVNDELNALKEGLEKAFATLAPGGRIAVISFHSLEDRIVKRFFQGKAKEGKAILINKKPIVAGENEIKNNPRSRSAKLRILEKNNNEKSNITI